MNKYHAFFFFFFFKCVHVAMGDDPCAWAAAAAGTFSGYVGSEPLPSFVALFFSFFFWPPPPIAKVNSRL